ncbi:MAG: Gx transporter family protein, partial [Clostridia bacterium]
LGLANIITLFALYFIGLPGAAVILILRCLLASLFGGGVVALMMSLSGGLLALFTMALTRRMRGVTLIGVSVAGAAMHGVGQIAAAMLILSNSGVIFYLPILLISGVFTGAIIGVVATFLFARLRRVSSVINYFGD